MTDNTDEASMTKTESATDPTTRQYVSPVAGEDWIGLNHAANAAGKAAGDE